MRRSSASRPASPPSTTPIKAETFADVAEQWLKRHVHAKGLRSEGEVTRLIKAHVYPAWGDRPFLDIRRSDVARLLDEVEDDHGARQADYVLAIVRGVMNFYASRADDYVAPHRPGHAAHQPERARPRPQAQRRRASRACGRRPRATARSGRSSACCS